MTELDRIWSQMIGEATANADKTGRTDVAQYLRLKASNDAIRSMGVGWLLDSILEIASSAATKQPQILIERFEPHNFTRSTSNMVGSLINVRLGVRCLSVEAGWTRTPADGVMIGSALAAGRIRHFGLHRKNAAMSLVCDDKSLRWRDEETDEPIDSAYLGRHFSILLT